MTKNKVQEYLKYEYRTKYPLEENGYWIIYGEDPNCDFTGPHHTPFLGLVYGKFIDVLYYAVQQERFYTWGFGGNIIKASLTNVPDSFEQEQQWAQLAGINDARRQELLVEMNNIQKQLDALKW